jgi:putative transposase
VPDLFLDYLLPSRRDRVPRHSGRFRTATVGVHHVTVLSSCCRLGMSMARPPRMLITGLPHHVVQRGHNRSAVFVERGDYEHYLAELEKWKRFFSVEVHAWCLMTNHVHLVLIPRAEGSGISGLMRRLAARHGRRVNRLEGRVGTLWCGRFYSSLIETDLYLLACLRYVETNPLRAGLALDPAGYPWSSYRERMGLAPPRLLDADLTGDLLGATAADHRPAYANYLGAHPDPGEIELIRTAVRRNRLTGSSRFVAEIEHRTGVRIENRGRGRPVGRK